MPRKPLTRSKTTPSKRPEATPPAKTSAATKLKHRLSESVRMVSRLRALPAEYINGGVRRLVDELNHQKRTAIEFSQLVDVVTQERDALHAHAIVSMADTTGRIVLVNDLFCEISGYDRDELLGQNHRLLNSGTHSPKFFRDMWRTIASGKTWHGLICNRAKNGRLYWVNSTIQPIKDSKGRIERYVSIRTNVTSLVKAQIGIKKAEKEYHTIFDSLQDVFYRTDADGLLTLVSPSVKNLLHYSPEELVGKPISCLLTDPSQRKALLSAMDAQDGHVSEFLVEVRRRDGHSSWLSINCRYHRSDEGTIEGLQGMAHDVSRLRQMEAELRAAKEVAENARDAANDANRQKSAFLASMSHELRTPMNSIQGFSQLLQLEDLSADVQDSVDHIYKASQHLLTLIDEVLDLSRIEAGKLDLTFESVDAGDLIIEVMDIVRTQAERKGITLKHQPSGQVLLARADRGRLHQVMFNLVSNAIKYNRQHGEVSIYLEQTADRVRISVADNGIGMLAEHLQQLFTPYTRFVPNHAEGTGLGLSITKQLVEAMDGKISVESEIGLGSTFWIELPPAAMEDGYLPAANASELAENMQDEVLDTRGTILYIGDKEVNQAVVRKALRHFTGVELLAILNPLEGLAHAVEHRPDLILLDINLPDIDGFEVFKRLRDTPETRDIPVVVLSANAMPADIEKAREAGFDDYLTKPVDIHSLRATVKRYLQGPNS